MWGLPVMLVGLDSPHAYYSYLRTIDHSDIKVINAPTERYRLGGTTLQDNHGQPLATPRRLQGATSGHQPWLQLFTKRRPRQQPAMDGDGWWGWRILAATRYG